MGENAGVRQLQMVDVDEVLVQERHIVERHTELAESHQCIHFLAPSGLEQAEAAACFFRIHVVIAGIPLVRISNGKVLCVYGHVGEALDHVGANLLEVHVSLHVFGRQVVNDAREHLGAQQNL